MAKVAVACEACGLTGSIDFGNTNMTLNTGKISVQQKCPKCGGEFSAPGGRYETDENGNLVRVGDYAPSTSE